MNNNDFFSFVEESDNKSTASHDFYSEVESKGFLKKVFTPKKQEFKTKEGKEAETLLDIYRPKQISAEDIRNMTLEEKKDWIEENKVYQDFLASKSMLSAASFTGSEYLTGGPEISESGEVETHHGGATTGMALAAHLVYTYGGVPLVNLISRSPIANQSLTALQRITAFGLSGAGHKTITSAVQGEIPSVEEVLTEGAEWMAIASGLELLGAGVAFTQSIQRIAESEGMSSKQVLSELWKSTKNYMKLKFGRAVEGEILPEDIEVLIQKAKQAETEGLFKQPEEIEIAKKEPVKPESKTPKAIEHEEPKQIEYKDKIKEFEERFKSEYVKPVNELSKDELIENIEKVQKIDKEIESKVSAETEIQKPTDFNIDDYEKRYNPEKGRDEWVKKQPSTSLTEEKIKEIKSQDISREGLKNQKQYILNELEDAINHPEKYKGQDKILIDVPGDGEFKINNTPEALEKFSKRVEKKWPKPEPKKRIKKAKPLSSIKDVLSAKNRAYYTQPRKPVIGKKQAVARSKIIKLFRKAFKDPIRLGKISQRNALGIHKLWGKVTRLLKDNNIETVAHEIGHNLHTYLYEGNAKTKKEMFKNINNALKPYAKELAPLGRYEPFLLEGFAEFTRMYVTNPNSAKLLAPNFYQKFESDLNAKFPDMKNALLEARDYYEDYLQGTPQSRIRVQTNYNDDQGKLANIVDWVKEKFNPDKLKTQFLDDVYPAKRLVAEAFGIPLSEVETLKDERNLYRSLRLLKGAVGKGDVFVMHETFDPTTLNKINGSLKDVLKQLPNEESYKEFNDYLIARRSIEKHGQKIETGINIGDALIVEKDLRAKYGKLAIQLDKYNDTLLQYAMKSGLMSQKQYLDIKANNLLYTPFQRVMEKKPTSGLSPRIQANRVIKRMRGSTRDIISPLESILKNTYTIIVNSEKNLSGQVLAKLGEMKNMGMYVEKVPTPIMVKDRIKGDQVSKELAREFEFAGLTDLIEYDSKGNAILRKDIADVIPDVFLNFGATKYPPGENIVTVYFDGKPKYYEVSPEIFDMWTKGIEPYTAGLLTKILRIPARTLRAGAILNPKFMLKNVVRDTWGSWLFTRYGKSIKKPHEVLLDTLYNPLAMLSVSAKKGPLFVEWLKSGGGLGTMQGLDRNNIIKKMDEVRHGYKPYQVMKWLRAVSEISEEANRLVEFGKALEIEGKTRLGREIAAFAARDLSVDFAKMGLQVRAINQIIPFFNATIQGGDKLLRALANKADRDKFLPRLISFIIIPSLIFGLLNKDDENLKEFQSQEQDFNFMTKLSDGTYLKIPVPFETGVIAHGLTNRMFNYFMKKDPDAFEKFFGSIKDAMLPNFIPTFANPLIETYANKNFFTGGRVIPREKEELIAKLQYKNNTSTTARLLGRAIAYMIGEETTSHVASPAVIEHFIVSWTGGLGRLMLNISDTSLEASGLADKIPRLESSIIEKLGLDAFIAKYPRANTRSIEKFYDNYSEAMSLKKSSKFVKKMDVWEDAEKEAFDLKLEKKFNVKTLEMSYKSMQACQKEINNIYNDPTIDSDLKQEYINRLYLEMIEFAKACNSEMKLHKIYSNP